MPRSLPAMFALTIFIGLLLVAACSDDDDSIADAAPDAATDLDSDTDTDTDSDTDSDTDTDVDTDSDTDTGTDTGSDTGPQENCPPEFVCENWMQCEANGGTVHWEYYCPNEYDGCCEFP